MVNNLIVKIQPFNAAVSFYVGDFNTFSFLLKKKYGLDPDRDCSLASAATFDVYRMDSEIICAVWIPACNKNDFSVIAHETVHAVGLICVRRGILYAPENTEVIAYLTEYLISEYTKKIQKIAS